MKPYCILFVFAVFALSFACKSVEVQQSDKQLFVRAQDLSEYGIDLQNPEKYEKFTKTRYFDGSIEIEYEFEPPESEETIYIAETVTFEPKESDAKFDRAAEDKVVGITLKAYGLQKEEVADFYKYGDSSTFYALKKDGKSVGNYFTVLEGKKVFSFMVAGVYFDDADIWREIVEPKLKLFSAYDPNSIEK